MFAPLAIVHPKTSKKSPSENSFDAKNFPPTYMFCHRDSGN